MTGKCTGCDRPLGTGRFQAVEAEPGRCTRCVESAYAGTPVRRTVQRDDDGSCQSPKWCGEPVGHALPHRRYLHSILIGRSSVAITLERGEQGPRRPVLSAGNGSVATVVLSWDALAELANAMLAAHRRHA